MPATATATAKHLTVSRQWLDKLCEEGVIERLPDGGFDLDDCRQKYIAYLRDRKNKPDKHADLIAARTRLAELKADELSGKLARIEDLRRILED